MSSSNNTTGFSESPTHNGDAGSPEPASEANTSIINKVRSRVSSILPSSISNWLSPSGRNGNLRRRRNDSETEELDIEADEEDAANRNGGSSVFGIPPMKSHLRTHGLPPTKRTKLNVASEADFTFAPRISQSIPFAYSTPAATSHLLNRRNIELNDSVTSTPFTFTAAVSGATNNNVLKTTSTAGDETTDEEIDADEFQRLPTNANSTKQSRLNNNSLIETDRRKLNIGRTSGNTAGTWLESGEFKKNHDDDEDDDDDRASNLDDVNGTANESASDGSESSAARKLAVYSSIQRDFDGQQKRRNDGLYGSEAGSLKMSRGNSVHPSEVGLNFASHLQGHKSLFPMSSDANRSNSLNASSTSLNSLHRRQTSLYGSTSALSDSRLLGGTHSPFYNGRTMFGGASAYSRRSSSMQRTLRVPTQIRPSSSLSATSSRSLAAGSVSSDQPTIGSRTSTISNTAQRILELMNQFTTPLNDVRKMAIATHVPALVAHRKRFDESDILASRSVRMNTPSTPYSRSSANQSRRMNTPSMMATELQVPTMSSLMQMKKVMQNKTEKVRELASGSNSILNKDAAYSLPVQNDHPSDKSSDAKRKIRNKITSTRANQKGTSDHLEIAAPVNLPDIRLQLNQNAPKLDLGITLAIAPSTSAPATFSFTNPKSDQQSFPPAKSTVDVTKKYPSSPAKSAASVCTSPLKTSINPTSTSSFNFSSPIALTTPPFAQNVAPITNFKFSEPIQVNTAANSKQSSPQTGNSFANHLSRVTQPAPQLKSGSVMDILGKSPRSTAAVSMNPNTVSSSNSINSFPVSTAAPLPTLSAMFASKSNQWDCDSCMLKNDASKTRCVACESPKPGPTPAAAVKPFQSTPATMPVLPPISQSFGNQFKAAAKTWECDACMIRNKDDATKCVACETAKPGQMASAATSSTKPSFGSFAPKLDAGFAGLVAKQSSKWECSACMTRNDSQRKKCECCDQEKPGSSSSADADEVASASPFGKSASVSLDTTSKFSFGVQFNANAPAPTPITAAASMPVLSAEKPSFTFGVQPVSTNSSAKPATFSFGTSGATAALANNKEETNSKKDDVDAAPKATFSFGLPKSVNSQSVLDTVPKASAEALKPTPTATIPTNEISTTKSNATTAVSSAEFGGFSFRSNAATSKPPAASFSFGSSTTTNSTFSFGSPSQPAAKPQSEPVANEKKSAFVFGSSSANVATSNPPSFGSIKPEVVKPLFDTTKANTTKSEAEQPRNGGFSFGSNTGATSANKVSEVKPNASVPMFGLPPAAPAPIVSANSAAAGPEKSFVFGSASKATVPSFGAPATNATRPTAEHFAPSQPPSFGTAVATVQPTAAAPTFIFGSSSSVTPAPSSAAVAPPTFGSATPSAFAQATSNETSRPVFGGFDTTANNAPSAFGSSTFGSSTTAPNPTSTPSFGNMAAFGSASTQSPSPFGQSSGVPSFGGITSAFGAAATTTPTGFVAPNNSNSDEPQRKKIAPFGSGMPTPSAQQPPAFSFGAPAAPNTPAKTPFNFSATAPPSFNFTGNQTQAQPQQQMSNSQPYTFGAPSMVAPNAGVFSFGSGPSETTPNTPFQFAAESASPNMFLPQTPSTNTNAIQQRRKVRAVRRNIR